MKRKLCSVLLALCMVLTLLPVSAMADDGAEAGESAPADVPAAETEYVAQIGEAKYKTLQAAIDAVPASTPTTIDVLADLTPDTLNTVASADRQMAFTKADVNITLNLNNHTVTALGGEAIKIDAANVTLTITNGTIENHATNKYSDGLYAYRESNNLNLTLTNVKIHSRTQGLAVQGLTSNSNVTINGGEIISSEELGIYYPPKSGTLTVNDAKIEGKTGIVVKGSNLIVKGDSEIIGVGDKVVPDHYYTGATDVSSSLTETGDAIYVESGYNDRDITVKIESGKLTSTNSYAIQYYDHAKPVSAKREISVTGGTFSDLSALDYLAESAKVTVKLAAETTKDVTIPAGANVTLDLNGHKLTNVSGHTITNNGNLTVTGNGTVDNITHAKAALYNNTGATATLNGGTFDRSHEAGSAPKVNGGNSYYTLKNFGTMTINAGVTVQQDGTANGGTAGKYSSLIANGWQNASTAGQPNKEPAVPEGGAVLTINGGSFKGGLNTIKNDDDAVLTINGGTFTNYTQAAFQNHGTAAVNGGTFTADSLYSIDNCGCDATHDPGKLTITNGTFTGTLYVRSQFSDVSISGGTFTGDIVKTGGTLSLTGGTYSSDPTAYVADTHIARKDGDAQYTVVAKANLTSGVYTSDPTGALAPGYVSYKNSDNSTYTVYYPVPVTPGNNNNSSSTTTKNPDGSTTTTTTDKTTGTVTETTKNPDGSTTTVETKKDGSVTATNKTANGSVGTVKTDANGNSEISASISAADVNAAAKKNEPVAAPVSVAPAASPAAAPVIKLSVPASAGEVSVVIPVTNAQQGTVAIKVNPDGTEEIIKTSVVTKDGVVLGVKGITQIKIVNNDKDFADTVGHWAESDVDFVSARELFTGTAPQTFSPEAATTRGMVVTVLARLAGESTDGGANWYDKGCAWAVTNGVSDGTDPNGTVTREQLAAMLYRYFGSPAVSGSLSFADASSVSEYAHDAMQWCVNNGIINGMDGLLNPQGQATRAQVSAMFARYIRLMSTK